jgi:hypothetical protein
MEEETGRECSEEGTLLLVPDRGCTVGAREFTSAGEQTSQTSQTSQLSVAPLGGRPARGKTGTSSQNRLLGMASTCPKSDRRARVLGFRIVSNPAGAIEWWRAAKGRRVSLAHLLICCTGN